MKLANVLFAVLALAACKKKLDTVGYEKKLRSELDALGITVEKVTCPEDISSKQGESFTCTITIEGKDYGFEATVTEIRGEQVDLSTRWVDGKGVVGVKLETAFSAELTKTLGVDTKVDCGEPLRFLDADGKVTCQAMADGQTLALELAFDDKLVTTGWELSPPPVSRARLLDTLTPAVQGQVGAGITLTCGDKALLSVPADGVVWCAATDGTKEAKLKVSFKPGTAELERWEIVP